MNKIKSIFEKLILFPEYILVTVEHLFKQLPANDREIVFTLEDIRLYRDNDGSGRLAYLTLLRFAEGGYSVYLHKRMDFLTYTRLGKYGRPLYSLKNVKVTEHLPKNTASMVYAFDTFCKGILDLPWKQKIFVNILKLPSLILGEKISLPYGMHPLMYQCKQTEKIESLRKNERNLKMFFGGNTVSSHYSNPRLSSLYGQMTRKDGLEVLESVDRVKTVNDIQELIVILKGKSFLNECRILKTDHKVEVDTDDWLDILSRCEFFVCLSGTDLPMCHHTVEAMSVGVIPIIAYHDWFTPALEHGKNAIVYSGKEDLARKIADVFTMGPEEISKMRQNVMAYYDETFGPKNFVRRFETQSKPLSTLLLYPKYKPTDWELQEAKPLIDALKAYFGNLINM